MARAVGDPVCDTERVRVSVGEALGDSVAERLREGDTVRLGEAEGELVRLLVTVPVLQREGESVPVTDSVPVGLALLEGTEADCDWDCVRDTVRDVLGLPLDEPPASAVPRSRERAARRCRAEVGKVGRSRSSGAQPLPRSMALPTRASRGADTGGARGGTTGASPRAHGDSPEG